MLDFSPHDIQAILLSVKVALAATVITVPFGFIVSYLLVFTSFRGKAILEGIVNLPLVLPPVVVGYLLLLLLGRSGPLGAFLDAHNIRIAFTLAGAVLAASVIGFPLLVRSIRIGMENIDEQFVFVSKTLGASWWDSILSVILPLSAKAIIAGMTLMFARSLGEFGATIILAGNIPGIIQTIPLAIYEYTSSPGGDSMALSLCLVSIVLSFSVLLVSNTAARTFRRR
jgi:molybdate transport system permease protein